MKSKVLLKFAKKGINLSPEAFNLIINSKNPIDVSSSIIVKLKSNNYSNEDLVSVSESTAKEIMINLGLLKAEKEEEKDNTSLDNFSTKKTDNETQDKIVNVEEEEKNTNPNNEINTPIKTKDITKPEEKAKTNQIRKEEQRFAYNTKNQEPTQTNQNNEEKRPETKQINEDKKIETKQPNTTNNEEKRPETKQPNNEEDKQKGYPSEYVIKIEEDEEALKNKKKYKRNEMEVNANFDNFKIIQDTSKKSYTSGEISNLVDYFQSRYNKIGNILSKRPELRLSQKIGDLTEEQTDLNLIVMITDIRITKNGHYLLECEDDTGSLPILISKDNMDGMKEAEKLMKDEVVGIVAEKHGDLAICKNVINPGVPRMPNRPTDFATVFTSDVHIGSVTFLEDAFVRFTRWLNGDFGNEEQMELASKVKYMIVGGDIVDGIGVYPNQDKELAIKDITAQYDEAARLLGDIRSDIKIIITPGNHDASRVAEPQPAVPEKYAKSLYELNNVEFVSNPSIVDLEGLKVLVYHGRGIDDMVMNVKGFSHERNDLVMKEFLEKRHLAPLYGERTPLASELEDHLVIDQVPDVLHTGHVHINTYKYYKGIHCINSGTFQTQTEFQKIYNIVPTPAEVPILYQGQYKQLKFI